MGILNCRYFFRTMNNMGYPRGKVLKKLIICCVILLLIFIAIGLIMPLLGRIDQSTELSIRQAKLYAWRSRIEYFVKQKGQMPASLYDVSILEDLGFYYIKVSVPQNFDYDQEEELLFRDPNYFFKEVEYVLSKHKHGWFVVELISGKRYPYRLMIDEKGNIFELEERNVKEP